MVKPIAIVPLRWFWGGPAIVHASNAAKIEN